MGFSEMKRSVPKCFFFLCLVDVFGFVLGVILCVCVWFFFVVVLI